MAITKSAAKHIKTDGQRKLRHRAKVKAIKGLEKKIIALAEKKETEELRKVLSDLFAKIDKAVKSGTIHRNKAARKKSRFSRLAGK